VASSSNDQREGGIAPPSPKRARLSPTSIDPSTPSNPSHIGGMTEEPFDSCYNDQTNGFDNGNGIDNDDKEWCDYDRRRKMNPKMTRMDSDLISLIGQHLREKGLK
jgi:hypothetical protein